MGKKNRRRVPMRDRPDSEKKTSGAPPSAPPDMASFARMLGDNPGPDDLLRMSKDPTVKRMMAGLKPEQIKSMMASLSPSDKKKVSELSQGLPSGAAKRTARKLLNESDSRSSTDPLSALKGLDTTFGLDQLSALKNLQSVSSAPPAPPPSPNVRSRDSNRTIPSGQEKRKRLQ